MAELRYNPLLDTWTMVASNRQNRPNLNKDYCPFCPGSGRVPDAYTIYVYANDFPALSQNPPPPNPLPYSELYAVQPSYGHCEVILFSSDHHQSLWQLPTAQIIELIDTWAERTTLLAADEKIKYIFPFENRGEAVGVTMHHPHGQLYAYSFVPLKLKTELHNAKKYYQKHGRNLFSDMIAQERTDERRIIFENDNFIAFIPFFTDYPFGVFIINKNSTNFIPKTTVTERKDLASIIKVITGGFDTLYNKRFPYMMCVHQAPVNDAEYADCADYYRLHIEFYPPWRAEDTIKYYASSEMGAWAAANTRAVEESAAELRAAVDLFISKMDKEC